MPFKSKKGRSGASVKPRKDRVKLTLGRFREQQRLQNQQPIEEEELPRVPVALFPNEEFNEEELPNEEEQESLAQRAARRNPRRNPDIFDYAEEESSGDEELSEDEDDVVYVPQDPKKYCEPLFTNAFEAVKSYKNMRLAVAVYFEVVLGSPREHEWKIRGTITTICGVFCDSRNAFRVTVRTVLRDVLHCQAKKIIYSAEGQYGVTGRKPIVPIDSLEAEIIADAFEGGNSIQMSTHIVNQFRKDNELESLTESAVRGCMERLLPEIKKIKKGKQGSNDVNSAWCQASLRWFSQLLLRFQKVDFNHDMFRFILGDKYDADNPPDCYNVSLLTKLDLSSIAWFDEIHKKCVIGPAGSRICKGRENLSICFKRDKDGKLDLENGKYPEDPKRILQVKYEREARFCFGFYLSVTDGVKEGKKIETVFDYTEKLLVTRVTRNKLRLQQIGCIRAKKGTQSSIWVTNERVRGSIYLNDSITSIQGIKQKTFEKLSVHGFREVKDLQALVGGVPKIKEIAASIPGISFKGLSGFIKHTESTLEGNAPAPIDHRLSDNPYLSLYGKDDWEEVIDRTAMAGKQCVTDLIDYMFEETENTLGSKGMVYHDALSLMTGADSVQYMKDKGYYERWILPENGLMGPDGGVGGELKAYRSKPTGNRPESNPCDSSLFSHLNSAVNRHVIATQGYDDQEKQFSLSTPRRTASAYKRVWLLYPRPETIRKDIEKVLGSFLAVFEAQGKIVHGLGDRNGRRHVAVKKLGGKRERRRAFNDYDTKQLLHIDAEPAAGLIVHKEKLKHESSEKN